MPTSPLDSDQLDALQTALGFKFDSTEILSLALTHQSFVNEHPTSSPDGTAIQSKNGSNERLEFLGDAIVGMVVADRLYSGAPYLPEGDLTVRRSQVVRRETLARTARSIGSEGLGEWLVMGNGEAIAGGGDRTSNLADAFEAIVGAVYLDGGFEAATGFVVRWLGNSVDEAIRSETRKDPKSLLQEYLQAKGSQPPRYQLISESGTPADIVFTMEVVIDSESIAEGTGSRKVDAEREAARKALESLKGAEN